MDVRPGRTKASLAVSSRWKGGGTAGDLAHGALATIPGCATGALRVRRSLLGCEPRRDMGLQGRRKLGVSRRIGTAAVPQVTWPAGIHDDDPWLRHWDAGLQGGMPRRDWCRLGEGASARAVAFYPGLPCSSPLAWPRLIVEPCGQARCRRHSIVASGLPGGTRRRSGKFRDLPTCPFQATALRPFRGLRAWLARPLVPGRSRACADNPLRPKGSARVLRGACGTAAVPSAGMLP
jgi:hypothetical protein